jgi:hypothetical protein
MGEEASGENSKTINIHFVPGGFSVTIKGLVEVPSG